MNYSNLIDCIFSFKELEKKQTQILNGYSKYIKLRSIVSHKIFEKYLKNSIQDFRKFFNSDEEYSKFFEMCRIFVKERNELLKKYNIEHDEKFEIIKRLIDDLEKIDYAEINDVLSSIQEKTSIFKQQKEQEKLNKISSIELKLTDKNTALIAQEILNYMYDENLDISESLNMIKNEKLKKVIEVLI